MPKLQPYSNLMIPADFALVNPAFLAAQAMTKQFQLMNEAAEKMIEPIRQALEVAERMVLPIKIMEDAFNTSLLPMVRAIEIQAESHRQMMESVSRIIDIRAASIGIFSKPSMFPSIINAEIVEEEKPSTRTSTSQAITISQPQALVPVIPKEQFRDTRAVMGIKQISGGAFQYKRKVLKKLSQRNAEGRLLSLFLGSKDLFISDTKISAMLGIPVGQSFSWILRNLKRKFALNGVKIETERCWNPDGYIVNDIQYLH